MASAGVGREVVNARALAAQVELADRQTELAIEAQAEAEKLAAEKIQFVKNIKALSSRYLDRAREELLRIREEAPDEVAGDRALSVR